MKIPVDWLELREDGTIVAKVKQKSGGSMPITVTVEQIHKEYPRLKNINSPRGLLTAVKKPGGKFNLPNLKSKTKREKKLETKIEERRWSKC